MLDWVLHNKQWLFSGVGVVLLVELIRRMVRRKEPPPSQQQTGGVSSRNIQAGRDVNIGAIYKGTSTDVRQEREAIKNGDPELDRMSTLTSEMRADLSNPENEFVREFFVLPNQRVTLGGSSKLRLTYYEDEHQNLRGMLDVLEERGYVVDVTPAGNNTPIYRMTESLLKYLRGDSSK